MPTDLQSLAPRYFESDDRLGPADLAAEATRKGISPELHSAQIALHAAKVESLDQFRAVLHAITTLVPVALQPDLLLMLGYRILWLPEDSASQTTAADAFTSAVACLDRQSLTEGQKTAIDGLREAAATIGPYDATSLREHIEKTVAPAQVYGGESIGVVAKRFNLSEEYLERLVIDGRAGAEVKNGESVEVVAKRYGIETSRGIRALVVWACDGAAIQEALRAEHPPPLWKIAQTHGITTPEGRAELKQNAVRAAEHKVLKGHPVDAIVQAYGIEDPRLVRELENLAIVSGLPSNEMREGHPVNVVASKYGITTKESIFKLERIVINGSHMMNVEMIAIDHLPLDAPAAQEMKAGGNVQVVAQKYGITTSEGIKLLENYATQSAWPEVVYGRPVSVVARERGITSSDCIDRLERGAMYGAEEEVMHGSNAQEVAQVREITLSRNITILKEQALKVRQCDIAKKELYLRELTNEEIHPNLESDPIGSYALTEAYRGMPYMDAASKYGITMQRNLALLKDASEKGHVDRAAAAHPKVSA